MGISCIVIEKQKQNKHSPEAVCYSSREKQNRKFVLSLSPSSVSLLPFDGPTSSKSHFALFQDLQGPGLRTATKTLLFRKDLKSWRRIQETLLLPRVFFTFKLQPQLWPEKIWLLLKDFQAVASRWGEFYSSESSRVSLWLMHMVI